MGLLWLSANKLGYVLLKEALSNGIDVMGIITLSSSATTIMYDGVPKNEWLKFGIPVYEVKSINDEKDLLEGLNPEIIVMCGWRQVISKDILSIPTQFIGFHPTLLPIGRGPAPIINTILSGFTESGLTMFHVSEGLDDGDIIGQEKFNVTESETATSLYEKIILAGKKLIKIYLPKIVLGTAPKITQDETLATIFTKPQLSNNRLDFEEEDMEKIFKKIRALTKPYKGAYLEKEGMRLIIHDAELIQSPKSKKLSSTPSSTLSSNNLRKICVVTGTRAEYGLLKPVMHLSDRFGYTLHEIEEDGFSINEKVEMTPHNDDSSYGMARSIGRGVINFCDSFKNLKPDIVLVLGDRTEALAAVTAAAYMNIFVAHIHGGDSGRAGLDESARHAITKFAHIHFPATQVSANRIRNLGEDDYRITVTGAPGLDSILHGTRLSKENLEQELNVSLDSPTILVVQHSVSTQPHLAEIQMKQTLEAIRQLHYNTIVICSNSDAGGQKITNLIKEYGFTYDFIHPFLNLHHDIYLSLLEHCDIVVGNSSSGVIESSSFGLPVVDIGIRQEGRERAENVISVKHDTQEIINAIHKGLSTGFKQNAKLSISPYGDGTASKKIVKKLASISLDKKFLQKKIKY